MSASINSSTSATLVLVKYDKVDKSRNIAGNKSIKKNHQKFKNYQKSKNVKGLKSRKSHRI